MICNNCGIDIDDGAGYCPNCGMIIGDNIPSDENNHKRKWSRKRKIVIGVIIAAVLMLAAVIVTIFHFFLLPQTQVVTAFANTMSTAAKSGINRKYGGYDMVSSMCLGNYDVEYTYHTDENEEITQGIRRNKKENKFITFLEQKGGDKDLNVSLYADKDTSVIGYRNSNEKEYAIQIDYADDMEAKIDNSFLQLIFVQNKDTLHEISKVYVDFMQMLTGTSKPNNMFDGLYNRTKEFFLDLEAEKCDKKTFLVNGEEKKCKVYHIIFNARDIAEYIQDCYNISVKTGENVEKFIEEATGYTLQELFDAINEKSDEIEDLDVYFAVNNKQQLVSIYCENVSKDNINMALNFYGGKYLCDEVAFQYSDDNGKEINITKDDTSEGDVLSVEYLYSYKEDRASATEETKVSYEIENDRLHIVYDGKGKTKETEAKITDYEKGKYMKFEMEDGVAYIGSQVGEIGMPECKNTLNLLDADLAAAYSFFSDISEH